MAMVTTSLTFFYSEFPNVQPPSPESREPSQITNGTILIFRQSGTLTVWRFRKVALSKPKLGYTLGFRFSSRRRSCCRRRRQCRRRIILGLSIFFVDFSVFFIDVVVFMTMKFWLNFLSCRVIFHFLTLKIKILANWFRGIILLLFCSSISILLKFCKRPNHVEQTVKL